MKRRTALAFLGIGALSGCGGGGSSGPAAAGSSALPVGGQTPGATSAEAAVSTPSTPSSAVAAPAAGGKNIACWGDSITNLYAPHLQAVFPDRQVYNGGVVGETSAQINTRESADTAHKDWVSIFWYGHNDW